ncbi:MAG: hypothetical protein A2836_03335 [Candidatus Taylorbacteria bacterium RIFCSPHIGHO2_01_FULL_45_63]|uniref:Uncharacterized protein n=1 Tax=Candidatus Taylorbacteria bacterium RIFCSPHIGHO2_02_FULL_45_35 TaxID=1802311 RepID=A0A1G2MPZ1_9BACT|nr:MAG: hypothetical protein A2836_03335 [Candidatus Taylorbacteria bacterium RIFCSPHIGHO2_01_FULL_45_63]OHA25923.1 MAG: hypothetical protein A3D56_02455 [Candidatus Taylorbacteria bacterium RIFCSPHIGHO2_02_FULL_45_35]OHA34748.1 MAG: hypothetical protein A3A22_00760 [Candidatus Taylorbacteria bacterium RIFCSPLOWO2_01_FULL_45_34b]
MGKIWIQQTKTEAPRLNLSSDPRLRPTSNGQARFNLGASKIAWVKIERKSGKIENKKRVSPQRETRPLWHSMPR